MPTADQVIKKVGKKMWDKMCATGWLDGITVSLNPDGTTDIPESDIERAYRAAHGERITAWEWD